MKDKKKRVKASLTFDMNDNMFDNPPQIKSVGLGKKVDKTPVKRPPLADDNERGDMDLANLQEKAESAPLDKLKEYNKKGKK